MPVPGRRTAPEAGWGFSHAAAGQSVTGEQITTAGCESVSPRCRLLSPELQWQSRVSGDSDWETPAVGWTPTS